MGTNIDRYFHHLSIGRCSLVSRSFPTYAARRDLIFSKMQCSRYILYICCIASSNRSSRTWQHKLGSFETCCIGHCSCKQNFEKKASYSRISLSVWHFKFLLWASFMDLQNMKESPNFVMAPVKWAWKKSAHTAKPEKRLAAPGTRSQLLCFPGQRLAHAKSCKVIVKFFSLRGCSA